MIASTEREQLMALSLQAIRNCVNLRSCTLTRDGSLSNDILLTLQQAPHLAELEINGRNFFYFKPGLLPDFKRLRKISLIMPSPEVLSVLPIWARNTTSTLRHLTLLCQASVPFSLSVCLLIFIAVFECCHRRAFRDIIGTYGQLGVSVSRRLP